MTNSREYIKAEAKRRIGILLFAAKLDELQQEDYMKVYYPNPLKNTREILPSKFEHHTCCF